MVDKINKKKTVLLGVTASIAAYKACDIINEFRRNKIEVVVCMSKDAEQFITPLTLQTLSGNRVYSNMFSPEGVWEPMHISLAERASVVLVAPATSNIISKVACGICDDLLASVIASTKSPVLFAPAMNDAMFDNKILQENIAKLKKVGYRFIEPIIGHLACGKIAKGHIADVATMLRKVKP
ncbi:MAG: flavoprotein, partial [Candidatus Omnitrophota bacterium]